VRAAAGGPGLCGGGWWADGVEAVAVAGRMGVMGARGALGEVWRTRERG
jgi:hypothetical protein